MRDYLSVLRSVRLSNDAPRVNSPINNLIDIALLLFQLFLIAVYFSVFAQLSLGGGESRAVPLLRRINI